MANRFKNKRSLSIKFGFPATAGTAAYDSSGNLVASGVELDLGSVRPGDYSIDRPGASFVDPLVKGEIPSDGAPILIDDQPMTGSIPVYKNKSTDAVAALLQDIAQKTGYAASTLKSTVANSPYIHGDLKFTWTNPDDATDTHGEIYRQAFITSLSESNGDPIALTASWSCRRTRLTDNDVF